MMKIPRKDKEVSEIVEALDARLMLADGDPAKAWDTVTPDELTYIDRELERVVTDRRYYLENYHCITDENGRLQTLYPFWDHQEIIYEALTLEWDENGCARLIILKPRQCGGTVWSAGIIFQATIFTPQAYSLMMAHEDDASAEIDRRVRVAFDNLPWWMRPDILSRQTERHWIFQRHQADKRMSDPGLGSTLLISNAQRKAGVAIGRTIRCAHFSEVSRWPDASLYTADIKPSMNARDILAIMESTAFGRNGLFFNQWRAAESGKSVWTPIFIPVYRVRKYYLPLLKGAAFTLSSEEKTLRANVKQKENFTIPLSFFNWKRQDIIETINSTGSDEDHYEAYPTTPGEAFISSGFCAFPKKCINEQEKLWCCDPSKIGEIEYNGPDNEPILRLHTPLPEELLDKPDRINRLWIWEFPDDNDLVEYYISGDIGGGAEGNDFTDIAIYKLPSHPSDSMDLVAEWHGLGNPSHIAKIIAALGYWYHNAEVAVEYMKAGVTTGDELFHQLDYPNIYRWKNLDKVTGSLTMHIHWLTNSRTRDDAINRMNERLLDRTIKIRNRHTIEEMRDFGRLEGDGRAEGLDNNDDMVMANIINVCASHQSGRMSSEPEGAGSSRSHLLPRANRTWGVYDHLMRQIDQSDSEEFIKKILDNAAKKYNGRVEEIVGKNSMSSTPRVLGWAVKLPDSSTLVSAREVMVMQANTPYSPIHDANGAEHELHYRHGIPERQVLPEIVQVYREILTAQHYEGDD